MHEPIILQLLYSTVKYLKSKDAPLNYSLLYLPILPTFPEHNVSYLLQLKKEI